MFFRVNSRHSNLHFSSPRCSGMCNVSSRDLIPEGYNLPANCTILGHRCGCFQEDKMEVIISICVGSNNKKNTKNTRNSLLHPPVASSFYPQSHIEGRRTVSPVKCFIILLQFIFKYIEVIAVFRRIPAYRMPDFVTRTC